MELVAISKQNIIKRNPRADLYVVQDYLLDQDTGEVLAVCFSVNKNVIETIPTDEILIGTSFKDLGIIKVEDVVVYIKEVRYITPLVDTVNSDVSDSVFSILYYDRKKKPDTGFNCSIDIEDVDELLSVVDVFDRVDISVSIQNNKDRLGRLDGLKTMYKDVVEVILEENDTAEVLE